MGTIDFDVLIGIENARVGLDTVAFGRGRFDFERDALGGRITYGERDAHVVVEGSAKLELVARVEYEAAEWIDDHHGTTG